MYNVSVFVEHISEVKQANDIHWEIYLENTFNLLNSHAKLPNYKVVL